MNHVRISGNETSSVILRQTKWFQKWKMWTRKCPKQAEANREGVSKSQNYNLNQFLYRTFWCSQHATNQPKSTLELCYMCPR